ncbi:MAG: hypothetical protein C0484_24820 [Rhodospirillum sp.]|nr:hypothetical protein [Rhodospirillum sp.]
MSLPRPPVIVSAPSPPSRTLSPLLPVSLLSPALPVTLIAAVPSNSACSIRPAARAVRLTDTEERTRSSASAFPCSSMASPASSST